MLSTLQQLGLPLVGFSEGIGMLSIVFVAATFTPGAYAHTHADGSFCGHEAFMKEVSRNRSARGLSPNPIEKGQLNPLKHPPHSRGLQSQQWRPLRIHLHYSDGVDDLDATTRAFFKQQLVEPAAARL